MEIANSREKGDEIDGVKLIPETLTESAKDTSTEAVKHVESKQSDTQSSREQIVASSSSSQQPAESKKKRKVDADKYSYTFERQDSVTSTATANLTWDSNQRTNAEDRYCYCGSGPRDEDMLYCDSCGQWFHQKCLKVLPCKQVAGDWAYHFQCAGERCGKGTESFGYIEKNWQEIVAIAVWNLTAGAKKPVKFVRIKESICKYLNANWDSLCYSKVRTPTWEATVASTMSTKKHIFVSGSSEKQESGWWGVVDSENPSYGKDGAGGSKYSHAGGARKKRAKSESSNASVGTRDSNGVSVKLTRKTRSPSKKRVTKGESFGGVGVASSGVFADAAKRVKQKKRQKKQESYEDDDFLDEFWTLAGDQPSKKTRTTGKSKGRQGQNSLLAWAPLYYQPLPDFDHVHFTQVDLQSAAQAKISGKRALTVSNDLGYRLCRASHGVADGRWYFEVHFDEESKEGSHVRLGWATKKADVQAPCGYDTHSFSVRSRDGSIFHQSRGKPYFNDSFGPGDVIGCYIDMGDAAVATSSAPLASSAVPAPAVTSTVALSTTESSATAATDTAPTAPPSAAITEAVDSSSQASLTPSSSKATEEISVGVEAMNYYERVTPPQAVKQVPVEEAERLKKMVGAARPNSCIRFYKNGKRIGLGVKVDAFNDIPDGVYYPAVSCYMGAVVTVNFGPNFKFLPSELRKLYTGAPPLAELDKAASGIKIISEEQQSAINAGSFAVPVKEGDDADGANGNASQSSSAAAASSRPPVVAQMVEETELAVDEEYNDGRLRPPCILAAVWRRQFRIKLQRDEEARKRREREELERLEVAARKKKIELEEQAEAARQQYLREQKDSGLPTTVIFIKIPALQMPAPALEEKTTSDFGATSSAPPHVEEQQAGHDEESSEESDFHP